MSSPACQATGAQDLETSRWRIDPTRSSVEFHSATLWGLLSVKGAFERYEGTLDLRREPAVDLTIAASSVNTKNTTRDKHLRSRDFFDVENYPQVRFVSDSVALDGGRLILRGTLHAAGNSVPLGVEADLRPVDDELEVDARSFADQRELGMTGGLLGMIRAPSALIVRGRLVQDSD